MPTSIEQWVNAIETIAPPHLAEAWDNVGLLVGDRRSTVRRTMLTIDYTPEVAEEARASGCDAVIAYHPPIFESLKRFNSDPATALVFDAARRGVAIYSPHTALDSASGGTNDVLADTIGMKTREPLKPHTPASTNLKLIVYVPTDSVERVASAVHDAGAGHVGNYSYCSFRSAGTGTFKALDGANPTIGKVGELERVDEVRLEVLVTSARLHAVLGAMRASHPYEEVAFDVVSLQSSPSPTFGIGRVGSIDPTLARVIIDQLKRAIGQTQVLVAGDIDRPVSSVAVCAGACGGDLLSEAIRRRVNFYVTGEMRHHDAVRAVRAGLTVCCTLHSNSERITLPHFAKSLATALPEVEFVVSGVDRDPFSIR
jgi:dinuclear metal center YbgI/SA1388 family protein